MSKRERVTRVELGNGRYPAVQVAWVEGPMGGAWRGEVTIWQDSDHKACRGHAIEVGESHPLGIVSVILDPHPPGCWATAFFEGADITGRDLQWATAWAGQAVQRKHERLGEACSCHLPPGEQAQE